MSELSFVEPRCRINLLLPTLLCCQDLAAKSKDAGWDTSVFVPLAPQSQQLIRWDVLDETNLKRQKIFLLFRCFQSYFNFIFYSYFRFWKNIYALWCFCVIFPVCIGDFCFCLVTLCVTKFLFSHLFCPSCVSLTVWILFISVLP